VKKKLIIPSVLLLLRLATESLVASIFIELISNELILFSFNFVVVIATELKTSSVLLLFEVELIPLVVLFILLLLKVTADDSLIGFLILLASATESLVSAAVLLLAF
jgi:hypothetical protein